MIKCNPHRSLDELAWGSVGLGVGRDAGNAVSGDREVVLVPGHVEEAVVAPVSSPGVAADPVLLAVLAHAVAYDGDLVVDGRE